MFFFSVFSFLFTRADSNCFLAFLASHVTAPDVLTFTALLYNPFKRVVTTPTAHIRATPLPSGFRIALSPDRTESSSRLALPTVIRRWVQSNEVSASVSFSSPRPQILLFTALGTADNVDNVVVLFLEERRDFFELAQPPEACFRLARSGHAMASTDNRHLVLDSLKWKKNKNDQETVACRLN